MDDRAIAELDAGDEAADAGADLDLLDRLEAAGEFIPIGDGALDRLRDRDGRWPAAPPAAGGLSPQPDNEPRASSATSAAGGRRANGSWKFPFESNASFFSRAQFHPLCTFATIDGGGCHNVPRRGRR